MVLDDLRFPTGRYEKPETATSKQRAAWIAQVGDLPGSMRQATDGLDDRQLGTAYRPDGWTVRQVVHHVADSHINAYVRFRLALTEETPVIKPYQEALWAELPDAKGLDISVSLDLLGPLHKRWVVLLNAMDNSQFARAYRHPELGEMALQEVLALYAWHCGHHLAHITSLRKREGW